MALGVALRQAASIELAEEPLPALLPDNGNKIALWWRKGWEQMRIPRVAFAMLVLCLVLVGTRLAMVEVGAHSAGNAMKIAVDFGSNGPASPCYLENGKQREGHDCSSGTGSEDHKKIYSYSIFLKQFDGTRFLLEVRAHALAVDDKGNFNHVPIMSEPAQDVWLTPGKAVEIPLADGEKMKLNGEWIDRLPTFLTMIGSPKIDPVANELRIADPMLVRDGSVAGDLEGFQCESTGSSTAAYLYYPKVGRLILALEQFPGSSEAAVKGSRVSFAIDGQQYTLVNGAPMVRADKIWVQMEKESALNEHKRRSPIGCGDVRNMGQDAQK
jgi:hypothetical protein